MTDETLPSLALLRRQRSHVLFILSNAVSGRDAAFLEWYRGIYHATVSGLASVLSLQQFERHEIDITHGRFVPLQFRYLSMCELALDGAEAASALIERISELHRDQAAAEAPATWLYYPVSEKVGRSPAATPSIRVLAFANAVPGQEAEFREWYATRHIRHALTIPALVSGQCFERTQLQNPGAVEARFSTIAVYEQEGTAEDFLAGHAAVPKGALRFPMLDLTRFSEAAFRPV